MKIRCSEELGIAIACLKENGQDELVTWVKEILALVISQRQRIVEETDGSSSQTNLDAAELGDGDSGDEVRAAALKQSQPSNEAIAKFEDYLIPYISDEQADAATKNPHVKLVFRLVKFKVLDDDADEIEWYAPASILPSDLQRSLNVIIQFEFNPLDLNGRPATELLTKTRRRRRRRRSPSHSGSNASDKEDEEDDSERKQKRKKKVKEKQIYKSAQFIEDSDAEYGDDDAFWAKEREHRERTARAAAEGAAAVAAPMRSKGTKKRKKRSVGVEKEWEGGTFGGVDGEGEQAKGAGDNEAGNEARKRARMSSSGDDLVQNHNSSSSNSSSDSDSDNVSATKSKSKSKRALETPVTTPSEASTSTKTKLKTKAAKKPKAAAKGKEKQKPKDTATVNNPSDKPKPKPRRPRPAYRTSLSPSPHTNEDDGDTSVFKKVKSKQKALFLEGDDDAQRVDGSDDDNDMTARPMSRTSQASTPLFLTDEDVEGDAREVVARKPKRIVISDDEDE